MLVTFPLDSSASQLSVASPRSLAGRRRGGDLCRDGSASWVMSLQGFLSLLICQPSSVTGRPDRQGIVRLLRKHHGSLSTSPRSKFSSGWLMQRAALCLTSLWRQRKKKQPPTVRSFHLSPPAPSSHKPLSNMSRNNWDNDDCGEGFPGDQRIVQHRISALWKWLWQRF